jgi:hydrogenase maturation protein HypF
MRSLRVRITGQVQGLGFRPHVYRLARALGVRGTVANSPAGVVIIAQGPRAAAFCEQLRRHPPPLARVSEFRVERIAAPACRDFRIVPSRGAGGNRVDVLPDLAICPDCRRDLLRPGDRRYRYPFTNCTQCGPRFTIIRSLPYDRPGTTMAGFRLCPDCRREYTDPGDRRFHAQPNACPVCGPRVRLLDARGTARPDPEPVRAAARALAAGRIVAIRSLGGFHLAGNAADDAAVRRLRRRKTRPAKPLALMVADVAVARRFCRVGPADRSLLASAAAPIVLLPKAARPRLALSPALAPGNGRLGVMLAYTPLHLALFAELDPAAVLVMTSANRRDDPMIADDDELVRELGGVFDLVLTHDRPIANRCDDSVVLAGRPPVIVRRARGWAPVPVRLAPPFHVKRPTLALGGELRNCFCLAAGDRAWLSPHLGSLAAAPAERCLRDLLERYQAWVGVRPEQLACDLHPDYFSTRLAERLSRELRLPLSRVQHHYAHAVSVLAEAPGEAGAVLAIAADGTGYGTDGAIWGCEFLVIRPDLNWRRAGHLGYLRLAGAGAELADPARVAAAYLGQVQARPGRPGSHRRSAPLTSSLGRLFDAVAAIAGVCRHASFEGEAAVALEAAVDPAEPAGYRCPVVAAPDGTLTLDPGPVLLAAAADAAAGVPAGRIAARFHNGISRALVRLALRIAADDGIGRVLLTGGSFQNSRLRGRVTAGLKAAGLTVRTNALVPVNDGGLSLGQAVAVGSAPAGGTGPSGRCRDFRP